MVDPAVPLAAVLQYVRQLFVPLGDCFLQQLNIRIVFPLIRKKFFFGKDPAHQVFIELGFEAFRLCHTFFIYPDLRGVFLGQLPLIRSWLILDSRASREATFSIWPFKLSCTHSIRSDSFTMTEDVQPFFFPVGQ